MAPAPALAGLTNLLADDPDVRIKLGISKFGDQLP